MHYLDDIDFGTTEFRDLYDELPLWSAPFGWMLLTTNLIGHMAKLSEELRLTVPMACLTARKPTAEEHALRGS